MKQLLTGLLLALLGGAAQAEVTVPPLAAHVTDLTATLTPDQRAALEGQLAQFESRKGSQVAVLIVPTTAPDTIEQYGIRVAEAWKIGRKGVDDGAILLVAKDDRALRIEVGYGLEGALPDVIAKRIIEEVIVPRFRENDFYGGIAAGTDRIIRVIDGEPLPAPAPQTLEGGINSDKIFTAVVPAVIFGAFLRMFMGRLPGALVAAALSAAIVWFLLGVLLPAVLVALLSFVLVLFGNAGGGFGGVGRGGGGGGFGGGGFSGGGGGFGGGGASGRW